MIAIITVTFNCDDIIQKTLESVRAAKKDFINLKHIIIDGKSTDNTNDIIKRYSYDYYVSEKDKGIYDAINKGIKQAEGASYILILHSGDTLRIDALETIFHAIKVNSPDLLAFSLTEGGAFINRDNYKLSLLSPAVKHPGLVIKKELHYELGFYDLHYAVSADYDFVCKILNNKKSIYYCNEVLIDQAPYGFSGNQKIFIKKKIEHISIISRHVKFPKKIYGYLIIIQDLIKGIMHFIRIKTNSLFRS